MKDHIAALLKALREIRAMRQASTTAVGPFSGGVAYTTHRFFSGDPERGYTFDVAGYTKAVEDACDEAIAQAESDEEIENEEGLAREERAIAEERYAEELERESGR